MSTKLNILGVEIDAESLGKPKGVKADDSYINEKLGDINSQKGETSLSSHFNYFFPDTEVRKVESTIRGEKRDYPAVNVVLCDKETNKPLKYGSVALSTFTRARYTYKDKESTETVQVNMFPEVPLFSKTSDGLRDYLQNNFVGKCFTASGEMNVITPRFPSTGGVSYKDEFGGQLNQRVMNTYKEIEVKKEKK